ncbi:MAG: 4-hydroxy-3-methylbut-2-enyl diphosphate reductase [Bacteroidales bacterium]|nr:4-hydroxy-3-methylbut-2-enyl diphosphate reductase [Bacteroidales bacterium]
MKVEVDGGSGFCFGVENAVEIAEKALLSGETVYCLGSIVHNDVEVERLRNLGLITISHEEYLVLRDSKVLIRAHGEPPSTYETALKNNIELIDATCPIVKRLQARIRNAWDVVRESSGQIVLFGKRGHAEVIGLLGQTANNAILINSEEDIDQIDFTRPVYLFSQTTMSIPEYKRLSGIISQRISEINPTTGKDDLMTIHNTICGQVSNREPRLRKFAQSHDIIIFVSGKESSNGKMLFEVCKAENDNSYMIISPDQLQMEWFRGKETAGVCGATSTPKWLIDSVAATIEKIAE